MNAQQVRILSVIAASAIVGVGAVVVATTEPVDSASGSTMQTGVTQTPTAPADSPSVGKAEPALKGPAPLPKEEQGLPG
ncbi:hypothetical protein A5724_02050 [Mycobacterium sp. ACS1612]|uniref:hypothetical protein n=1 Tax=Mycobacterium sp. ACS1612 TaxID=1834117 RepID=UPI0007FDA6F4|nr:hypothetical protein [Mycobacterium sp. ACS1612]OBF32164.1 hypothetical protein A5724_02050 [Mycobacterium sp. ACS1612]